jgi:hypothetical protein
MPTHAYQAFRIDSILPGTEQAEHLQQELATI